MARRVHAGPFGASAPAPEPFGAPGPSDTRDTLSEDLVNTMQGLFGKHPGYRTTHAKGLLVEGKFTPTAQAKTLSTAAHFKNSSTPVIARFSVGGGLPHTKDTADGATPKGIAIRFQVDDDTYSDIIAHSFNGFATRTGEEYMEFLRVFGKLQSASGQLKAAKPRDSDYDQKQKAFAMAEASMEAFVKSVPTAGVFLKGKRPDPYNYGTLTYYQPNTHVLTNSGGKVTNVRYRLDPADGDHLYKDPKEIQSLPANYLEDDLKERFPGKPIVFTIQAQIANSDDILDDATKPYKSTVFVSIGKLELNKISDDNVTKQKEIAFSPVPSKGGIDGIESSRDPLIQARKGVYWVSADQRRNERQIE